MEKLNLNQLWIALVSIILFSTSQVVLAQDNPNEAPFKELRKEVREYTQKEVLPVLKELRLELDNELSGTDKQIIEEARQSLKENRESGKALRQQIKEARENDQPIPDESKIALFDLKENKREATEKIREVAQQNEALLGDYHDKIRDDKETWQENIQDIVGKYKDDIKDFKHKRKERIEGEEHPRREGRARRHGKHRKRREMGEFHRLGKIMSPVGFLLFDPNNIEQEDGLLNEPQELNPIAYPNPVSNNLTKIEFDNPAAGQVVVTLLNRQGQEIKTLLNEQQGSGKVTLDLDTEDLENGVYFYKVTTSAGSDTKRIVIRK